MSDRHSCRTLRNPMLQLLVNLLESFLGLLTLADLLLKRVVQSPERTGFPIQLNEDRHLRLEDVGRKRLEDVVHAAHRVPLADMNVTFADCGEKYDRRVTRLVALPDQSRRLEPIHLRHFDVEKNDSSLIPQQVFESFGAGHRLNQILVEAAKYSFQREQIVSSIINQKNVDLVGGSAHLFR